MQENPWFIQEIKQEDLYHFSIVWNNGEKVIFRLSDLQKQCPCRECRDEKTGKFIKDVNEISETIYAKKIMSIGNYALRIEFTQGCSQGIYTLSFLRRLKSIKGDER